jgi:hypothetical protein
MDSSFGPLDAFTFFGVCHSDRGGGNRHRQVGTIAGAARPEMGTS